MGTRCLTTVQSQWNSSDGKLSNKEHHATIYRHWDGYPSGHGATLLEFLRKTKIVNGRSSNDEKDGLIACNGPGEFAAQLVKHMIDDGCNPGLVSIDSICGQEWHYVVDVLFGFNGAEKITVSVYDGPVTAFGAGGEVCKENVESGKPVFSGTVDEYEVFIEESK